MLASSKKLPLIFLSIAVISLPFSLVICHVALTLFLACSIVQRRMVFDAQLFRNSPILFLIALLFIFIAGMFYADDIDNVWMQLEKKIFFFLVPLTIAVLVKLEKEEVSIILFTFVVSCLVASLTCLVNSFHQVELWSDGVISLVDFNYLGTAPYKQLNPGSSDQWMLFSYRSLASGVAMHPTYLSLYFAFCIIIIIHFFDINHIRSSRATFIAVALITYFSIFIIFLSSRIIIIGLVTLLIFTVLRNNTVRSLWKRFAHVVCITIAVSIIIYVNPITRYRCYQEFFVSSIHIKPGEIYSNSTEIRASLWWIGLRSIQNINWIWGSGTGKSEDIMKTTSETYRVKNILRSDNPHSQFICTILQHGVMGVLVLMALLMIPMISALSKKDYLVFGFCALIITSCITETVLELQKGIDFFAVFYPLLLFHHYPHSLNFQKNQTSYG